MQFAKCMVIVCISFQLVQNVLAHVQHELTDEYDDDIDDEPSIGPQHFIHMDPDLRAFERTMLRDMAEDEPEFFNDRELRIRDALLRSTQDVQSQRSFSKILPILQSLTEAQRLTLTALIAAQTNTKTGKSLDLSQVAEMFGERRNLVLPIITNVANIIKKNMVDSMNGNYHANEKTNEDDGDESRSASKQQQQQQQQHRSKRSSRYDDDRPSYHERKLNMTNFRGTPDANDQHAIESETRIHVSLPNSNVSTAFSLEEIENLAFRDLNATVTKPSDSKTNNTNIENLPEPEMLIRPYRVRPRPISERFDNIYLYVVDYPIHQIMGSIRRHKYAMSALLADNPTDWRTRMQELENKKRREDEENNIPSSGMCPSLVRYARPQKARSASGEWKYIVNTGQHTQTLRLEKCTHPEAPCTYLTDNFSSRCSQVYNYHRLLSWDNKRGLHIDIFKVPTCCSCQIDGYREKFPPIGGHALNDDQDLYETRFSASDALYSLANNESDDHETGIGINIGDVDESPSELSTSTAYRPISHHTKKQRFDKHQRKKLKRPTNSLPDTFLTPPASKYEPEVQFKRKQSIPIANRASTEIQAPILNHPVLIGSDDVPPPTERPSKNGFTPIHVPPQSQPAQPPPPPLPPVKNVHGGTRLAPSKVLIKRVNYNYHPIIDFFMRDRAAKTAKAKENGIGHTIVS